QSLPAHLYRASPPQAPPAPDASAAGTPVATGRFPGGAPGLTSTTTATPPGAHATLTLHCERGVVEIGQGEITRWDVDGVPAPQGGTDGEGIGIGAADPTAIGLTGHIQQWGDILAAIAEGRDPPITAADGAATVRLIDAITTAARTGRLTTLKEL